MSDTSLGNGYSEMDKDRYRKIDRKYLSNLPSPLPRQTFFEKFKEMLNTSYNEIVRTHWTFH